MDKRIIDRYDNTEKPHFHCINNNPVGRHTGDCVVRAMASFLGWTWRQLYADLYAYGIENGMIPNYCSEYHNYLLCQGFGRKKPKKTCTVKEFLEQYTEPDKTYLVEVQGHLTCITGGQINDSWDCSNRKVKLYWERKDTETRKPFYRVEIHPVEDKE